MSRVPDATVAQRMPRWWLGAGDERAAGRRRRPTVAGPQEAVMAASGGPIRSHSTKTSEDDWHGSRAESMMDGATPQTMRRAFAWVDPQWPDDDETRHDLVLANPEP